MMTCSDARGFAIALVLTFVVAASPGAVALGCVSTVDLGSHASLTEGGAPADASVPNPLVDASSGGRVFFVTDGRYTGDLAAEGAAASGLAGADALCTREAVAAGLGGVFKAWLSTANENARDRIAPVGPWHMVDGTVVFASAAVDQPQNFPKYSAKGNDLFFDSFPNVWTGTTGAGRLDDGAHTCAGWTSARASDVASYGALTWTSAEWTDARMLDGTSESSPCSDRLRLYCFAQ